MFSFYVLKKGLYIDKGSFIIDNDYQLNSILNV